MADRPEMFGPTRGFSGMADSMESNGTSDPLHVWFQARVFWVGGSNGAISGSIISKMAADGHLGRAAILE